MFESPNFSKPKKVVKRALLAGTIAFGSSAAMAQEDVDTNSERLVGAHPAEESYDLSPDASDEESWDDAFSAAAQEGHQESEERVSAESIGEIPVNKMYQNAWDIIDDAPQIEAKSLSEIVASNKYFESAIETARDGSRTIMNAIGVDQPTIQTIGSELVADFIASRIVGFADDIEEQAIQSAIYLGDISPQDAFKHRVNNLQFSKQIAPEDGSYTLTIGADPFGGNKQVGLVFEKIW